MNVKLECYSDAPSGKACYVITQGSSIVEQVVLGGVTELKQGALYAVYEGLKRIQGLISHEDVLYIVVQSEQLRSWLSCEKSERFYKNYLGIIDKITDTIDRLDCRYRVVRASNQKLKKFVVANEPTEALRLSGIDSLAEFGEENVSYREKSKMRARRKVLRDVVKEYGMNNDEITSGVAVTSEEGMAVSVEE